RGAGSGRAPGPCRALALHDRPLFRGLRRPGDGDPGGTMKTILNLTPTGMVPTKAMTPHVPISAGEIIEDVLCCAEIGITMVHLHARDQDGLPTYKAEVYGRLIEGIRRYAPQLVICVSLSGRNVQDFAKRAEPLGLQGLQKPDMGSLTLSSLNFTGQASVNEPETIKMLAHDMLKRGIVPRLAD